MDLANCKQCGKVFQKVRQDYCESCLAEQEQILLEVQRYVKDHPSSGVPEVAEAFELEESQILHFVRENRLTLNFTGGGSIECESCGAPIVSGRLCVSCRQQLGGGFAPEPEKIQVNSDENDRRDLAAPDTMIKDKYRRK